MDGALGRHRLTYFALSDAAASRPDVTVNLQRCCVVCGPVLHTGLDMCAEVERSLDMATQPQPLGASA